MPDERARHCSVLAACAPASAAIVAPKSRRTPRGLTDTARLCPCHPIVKQLAKRPAASCGGGFRPRSGPQRQTFGGAPPHCALRRPPRPLAPLRGQHVSLQVQKCACVVLVQDHGNVCWSVHLGRVRACARVRVCSCAAQALPNEPTHAGNGSPVLELPNYRTSLRARGHPPCRALFTGI